MNGNERKQQQKTQAVLSSGYSYFIEHAPRFFWHLCTIFNVSTVCAQIEPNPWLGIFLAFFNEYHNINKLYRENFVNLISIE